MTETPRPNTAPWSTEELRTLRANAQHGAGAVSAMLGRSEAAIWSAAKRYRISLRRRGETRGKILGQRGAWSAISAIDSARRDGDPYDVVHVHWWFPSGLALWKASRPGAKGKGGQNAW